MVYPYIAAVVEVEVVVTIDVMSSRTLESKVSDYDIATIVKLQNTRCCYSITSCGIHECCSRQSVNGFVLSSFYPYNSLEIDGSLHVYGLFIFSF